MQVKNLNRVFVLVLYVDQQFLKRSFCVWGQPCVLYWLETPPVVAKSYVVLRRNLCCTYQVIHYQLRWIQSFKTIMLNHLEFRVNITTFFSLSCIMSSNGRYKFRFNMSQDGTKRIQPKRQTLDDAYSPPG